MRTNLMLLLSVLGLLLCTVSFSRESSLPRFFKFSMILLSLPAAIGSYFSTFRYQYFSNPNTQVFGWPIPMVIWQRDTPQSPWLDFVGPTLILAYPLNLFVFYGLALLLLWSIRLISKQFAHQPA